MIQDSLYEEAVHIAFRLRGGRVYKSSETASQALARSCPGHSVEECSTALKRGLSLWNAVERDVSERLGTHTGGIVALGPNGVNEVCLQEAFPEFSHEVINSAIAQMSYSLSR